MKTHPTEHIHRSIQVIRGVRVMLDFDLADLYGVEVRTLNQAVKRNLERFPADFMFQLSPKEANQLKATSIPSNESLRSQFVILKAGRGSHRKHASYAFTEQGIAMLSSVLRSKRAILVNIEIMRAFVLLRALVFSNAELARRLNSLEKKYDAQFKVVFDAIQELMAPPRPGKKRSIGFAPWQED